MPPAVTVNGVLLPGVSVTGDGLHVLGGAVFPEAQLNVTVLVYPFNPFTVPLNNAVCPAKTVSDGLETDKVNSGVITRLNSQMPRP